MDMVGHAAEGVNAAIEFCGNFVHYQVKAASVSVINEYWLTSVTAKDDVVESAGEVNAWFAWHSRSISYNV
jgi:hypothetical protein